VKLCKENWNNKNMPHSTTAVRRKCFFLIGVYDSLLTSVQNTEKRINSASFLTQHDVSSWNDQTINIVVVRSTAHQYSFYQFQTISAWLHVSQTTHKISYEHNLVPINIYGAGVVRTHSWCSCEFQSTWPSFSSTRYTHLISKIFYQHDYLSIKIATNNWVLELNAKAII